MGPQRGRSCRPTLSKCTRLEDRRPHNKHSEAWEKKKRTVSRNLLGEGKEQHLGEGSELGVGKKEHVETSTVFGISPNCPQLERRGGR